MENPRIIVVGTGQWEQIGIGNDPDTGRMTPIMRHNPSGLCAILTRFRTLKTIPFLCDIYAAAEAKNG